MEIKNLESSEWQGFLKNQQGKSSIELQHIHKSLDHIRHFLEKEIDIRQKMIDRQLLEMDKLRSELDKKNTVIVNLQHQLEQCGRHEEGSRQLINKLLNDISHYQCDIEWYKKTYEKRSIWGVFREKLLRKA